MRKYTVITLRTEDDLDRLIDEVGYVTGLCEICRKGDGLSEMKGEYLLYEAGKTEDNPNAKGLRFQTDPKIKDCVSDFQAYSNRLSKTRVNLQRKGSVTVINAYTPTSSAEDEKAEQSYNDIEETIAESVSK